VLAVLALPLLIGLLPLGAGGGGFFFPVAGAGVGLAVTALPILGLPAPVPPGLAPPPVVAGLLKLNCETCSSRSSSFVGLGGFKLLLTAGASPLIGDAPGV